MENIYRIRLIGRFIDSETKLPMRLF